MTFSDMGWGKVNEEAVEFHNEQWVRAFLMGKIQCCLLLKVRVRFNKKNVRELFFPQVLCYAWGEIKYNGIMLLNNCFATQIEKQCCYSTVISPTV